MPWSTATAIPSCKGGNVHLTLKRREAPSAPPLGELLSECEAEGVRCVISSAPKIRTTPPQSARSGCQLPQRWSQGGRAADGSTYSSPPTGAMCKIFRPVAVYRLGTVMGLFIIQGVQVRRRRGIQSIIACRPSPGLGDRRSAPHRPSCGCAVPHRKVWQAYCRLHLEADMHRFLAIFALSIR